MKIKIGNSCKAKQVCELHKRREGTRISDGGKEYPRIKFSLPVQTPLIAAQFIFSFPNYREISEDLGRSNTAPFCHLPSVWRGEGEDESLLPIMEMESAFK